MSLLDVILSQKIIVISIAMAMLPLLVAILLALTSNLRQFNTERKARRKHAAAQRASELWGDTPDSILAASPGLAEPKHPETAPLPQAGTVSLKLPQGEQAAGNQTQDNQQAEGGQEGEAVSSAMQDLLSSVFVDDEALEQRDVLLEGTDSLDAFQLATLCTQIAEQLHAASAAVGKSKEQ